MGLRTIENASMDEFVYELRRMLNDGIRDPEVRRVAVSVTSPAGRNTEMDIFGYLKNHFRYVPDPIGRELVVSPRLLLNDIESIGFACGDCDDISLLVASMYGSIGHEAKIVLVDEKCDGVVDHAIACVKNGYGVWMDADLSGNVPLGWVSNFKNRIDIAL